MLLVLVPGRMQPLERGCHLKTRLLAIAAFALAGCEAQQPVQVDAPELASSLKWVGCCAVVCSTIGAIALITASRNRRK